tara:strand:- start:88 stop:447 length:360 start_codon:yes stop_codon:yes gene_type:complete
MEYYIYSHLTGPYTINCSSDLAEALSAGHYMLPNEDVYMRSLEQWSERMQDIATAEAKAYRDAKEAVPAVIDGYPYPDQLTVFEEPDYSSPEYMGEPIFDDEDLPGATEIPFNGVVFDD